MILLDVGVWLAAVHGNHVRHPQVAHWFDSATDQLAFCRITQNGLLRLLTNSAALGPDVCTRSQAWSVLDGLRSDERVIWVDEPPGTEAAFRALSAKNDTSHKLWTDDYLAAFAQVADAEFATLDHKIAARYPSVRVRTL
ncbi:MAG: hypothetical protein QM662_04835 [Gordonia sp. (in: high G+C Gram-positive bacteria)]